MIFFTFCHFGTASFERQGKSVDRKLLIGLRCQSSHSYDSVFTFAFFGAFVTASRCLSLCSILLLRLTPCQPVFYLVCEVLRVISLTGLRFVSDRQVTVLIGFRLFSPLLYFNTFIFMSAALIWCIAVLFLWRQGKWVTSRRISYYGSGDENVWVPLTWLIDKSSRFWAAPELKCIGGVTIQFTN